MYIHKQVSLNGSFLEYFPFKRESFMSAYLMENENVLCLLSNEDSDFTNVSVLDAEVKLLDARKDKNTDGRIDIFAKYGGEHLAIIELKNDKLTKRHLEQLEGYLKERKQILEKKPELWQKEDEKAIIHPKWIGVLVGTGIDPELRKKIEDGYCFNDTDNIQIQIAAITINRYKGSDGNVYIITDTYFVEKNTGKDYTKYVFNGKTLGKGRLVLEVIKNYVENNPKITYNELKSIFFYEKGEVFVTIEDAKKKAEKDRVRHFIKSTIKLSDETIAVSSQWGISNIGKFIEHCEKINIKIEEKRQ